MKQSLVTQLAEDISWIFSLQPHNKITPVVSVFRLLYWHLYKKRLGNFHIGRFQDNYFLYEHYSDGSATAFITPHYDYSIQTFMSAILQPGDVFIDVGANVGTETLLAAQRGAIVHSFEPTPSIFSSLQINVLLNNYQEQCHLEQKAVSNVLKPLSFFVFDDGHQLLNSLVKGSNTQQKSIKVQTVTLDSYLSRNKVSKVSLIKIDVEGAERLVFEGAKKSLKAGKLPAIIWESNLQASSHQRNVTRSILDQYGFRHFWWNGDKKVLEKWNDQENCFSIQETQLPVYKKLLHSFKD